MTKKIYNAQQAADRERACAELLMQLRQGPWTLGELAKANGVKIRTVRSWMGSVQQMGYPIWRTMSADDSGEIRYRIFSE